MSNILKRVSVTALAMAMLTMGLVAITNAASAQTGPWQWSDISDKLSVRENRPVWASAYAHPYWYLTDGQELYTGGRVWKTDGAIITDITNEVRNAGLNRVDDIVTDGITVIYLKNITTGTRNFEALAYTNGKWSYPAQTWMNHMQSNEGIASITGKNGVWIIITSHGKILEWKTGETTIKKLQISGSGTDYSQMPNQLRYSVKHSSPIQGVQFFEMTAVPVSGGWLFTVNNIYQGSVDLYKYTNSGFTKINNLMPNKISRVSAISSNGTKALIAGSTEPHTRKQVYIYNGQQFIEYTDTDTTNINWHNTIIGNNGKSWMILEGKHIYRLTENQSNIIGKMEHFAQTRDYFVTVSSDNNGRFLLGGAISAMGLQNPTSPLTAKLVRIDETTGYVAVPPVTQTSNWVWSTMSVSHNQHNLYHGQSSDVKITSGSPNGINRIEIWLNGNVVKTCQSATCDYTINSSSYTKGSKLAFNGRAIDTKGHEAWTWLGEYTIPVDDHTYNNNYNTTNNNITTWFDSNTIQTALARNESRNITFYGNANQGLNRLELYANNSLISTCNYNNVYDNQSCTKTIYGSNYSSGQSVTLKVKAIDKNGYQNWSGSISFNIQDDGSNNNGNYVNSWMWFEPSDTNFADGESSIIKVQAVADSGLNKIEVYANNSLIKTCNFSRAYGTQNCEVTIYANNYNSNSTINIYAKATDYSGRTDVTDTMSLYRNGSNNNNTGTQVYSWMWLDPSDTNLDQNISKTINVGASADSGLQKIEIYADGGLKKTCTYNRAYGNQQCSVAIYGNEFTPNRNISIMARAYDYNGRMAQTSSQNVYITGTNNNNNNDQTNVDGNLTITSNRDSGYTNFEQITFTANGSDANGINKIEILVNAQVVKTCNGVGTCSYVGGPYNTETISYGANLYDNLGNRTWTGYKTIYKK